MKIRFVFSHTPITFQSNSDYIYYTLLLVILSTKKSYLFSVVFTTINRSLIVKTTRPNEPISILEPEINGLLIDTVRINDGKNKADAVKKIMFCQVDLYVRIDISRHFCIAVRVVFGIFRKVIGALMLS